MGMGNSLGYNHLAGEDKEYHKQDLLILMGRGSIKV